jgi:hypothetical protein
MKLRQYPFAKWPPTWTRIDGTGSTDLTGEIGTLRSVSLSRVEPITTCYILVDFQGSAYMGKLLVQDATVCRRMLEFLQQHCGYSIQQIGNLDMPDTIS